MAQYARYPILSYFLHWEGVFFFLIEIYENVDGLDIGFVGAWIISYWAFWLPLLASAFHLRKEMGIRMAWLLCIS